MLTPKASKQLFHVVTYGSGERYSFYLTADAGIKNSEIENRLSNYYERRMRDQVFFIFGNGMNHDNKGSGFYVYISDLDLIDDRVLKNVREYSPDVLVDVNLFKII